MGMISKQLSSLTCLLSVICCCHGGNILVWPEDGSHWVNMKVILRKLHSHSHSLTVVRSSKSWYIQENPSLYSTITVNPVKTEDVGPDYFKILIEGSQSLQRMSPFFRFLGQQKDIINVLKVFHNGALQMISAILDDSALVRCLQEAKFDLLLTDPAFPAGVLLAKFLHLPMVYNVRWLNAGDPHMQIAPSPPSYVPMYNSLLHDQMNFLQRTENFLWYLISCLQERYIIVPIYSELLERHFPPGTDLLSMLQSADIWLMRVDFLFEFPRPAMPNVVYMGGFQSRPAQALPAQALQVATLTSQEFLKALKDVLKNPLYRSSIRKISELHRDQPLTPLESAIFWIEYVIRHKGAAHLRSKGNSLPWYSYHSLDVLTFLLMFTVIALLTSVYVCKLLCCRKSIKKRKVE